MSTAKGSRFSHLAPLPGLSGLGGLLLLAAIVITTAASGRLQASAKADFTLSASPTSGTTQQGQAATFTLTEQKLNGFNSPVALTAGNLPSGATATFSPQTLDSKTTSTLTIAGATQGSYSNITVTGSGGGITKSLALSLTVSAPPSSTFSVAATPSSATLLPGNTASYSVATGTSSGFTGNIAFSVAGAPAGATSTFTPAAVAVGSTSTLQVATKNNTAAGTYTLTITGTSGLKQQSTTVTLVVALTGKQFTITAPGVTVPGPGAGVGLDLSITNPNSQPMQVTNLTVALTSVTKAASAPATRPCGVADYAVAQFSGSYPLTIPAGATVSLSSLGVSPTSLPQLSMLNSSQNQDGCKGATLSLSFSGAGQG
jgi:hypothetical protein